MLEVTYSERWSDPAGKPTDVLAEEAARQRHESGEPYTVTLGDTEDPEAVLDVAWNHDHLGVWFFDEQVRRSVHYSFTVREGKLFLDMMKPPSPKTGPSCSNSPM